MSVNFHAVSTRALLSALAVSALCVGMSGTVFGADMSLKDRPSYEAFPETIWTGLYVGGHIGGSWGNTDISDTYTYNVVDPHKDTNISNNGLLAGGQVGYNVQKGNLVYGIEADIGRMDISGDGSAHLLNGTPNACDGSWNQKCQLDAKYSVSGGLYGDIAGRLGYASEKSLFYVKGGPAFLNVDVDTSYVGDNGFTRWQPNNHSHFGFDQSETMWGWTVGAGVEYALSPSLSLKAEYQHFDFGTMELDYNGSHAFNGNIGVSTLNGEAEISPTVDAISVGVNYHVGGDRGALK